MINHSALPLSTASAIEGLELIADTFLSVSTPVQYAAPTLLGSAGELEAQIRTRAASNLALLREQVAGSACTLLEVEGGWYATLRVPHTRSEEEWCLKLIEEQDVLVQPGFFYDFPSEALIRS